MGASARKIEQVVSRYHPVFDVPNLKLGYGLDGNRYLVTGGAPDGRLLRLGPDGSRRFVRVGAAALAVTGNAAGVIAVAEHHFAHRIVFYDADFTELGHYDDFAADDTLGHTSPSGLEAAASGTFYALDQHRRRVLRLNPDATLSEEIPLTGLPQEAVSNKTAVGLRVAEGADRIYTAWSKAGNGASGVLCATDLSGQFLWCDEVRVSGGLFGGFDANEDGELHVIVQGRGRQELRVYQPGSLGQKAWAPGTIALPDDGHEVQHLRLRDKKYHVKRNDPFCLVEVYDAHQGTGTALGQVPADVERLSVQYDADVWTAGRPVPLTVTHTPGSWAGRPRFRVWLRPLGLPEFTELPLSGGAVTPPADARGLYQVRVSPDVGGRVSEYVLDGIVEIRPEGAERGSLSLMSCRVDKDRDGVDKPPVGFNRLHYGRGEAVTVAIAARAAAGVPLPTAVRVVLTRAGSEVREWDAVHLDATGVGRLDIGPETTAALEPGRYIVDADAPAGFTVAPQYLEIGPGLATRPDFHLTLYSDIYAPNHACFPIDPREVPKDPATARLPRFADLPDLVQAHLARMRALGLNLAVDRLGVNWGGTFSADYDADGEIVDRLKKSPAAVHWQKAVFEDVGRRTIAGYGAYGIEEQAVLLYNDAFLPLDWPKNYESRDLPKLVNDLTTTTDRLATYAAFRGWTWGANWWNGPVGVAAAESDAERTEYNDRLQAIADGDPTWAPVLDTVTDRSVRLKPTAAEDFRKALDDTAPGLPPGLTTALTSALTTALTPPYRQPQTVPPVLFAEADEVDLHYQGEQIQVMLATAHMVDFYRRPGKPVWGHPELSNDDGTGGMILPTLFQQVLRGPNGTGLVPDEGVRQVEPVAAYAERTGGSGWRRGEPRSGGAGKTSVQRAAFDLIARLAPAVAGARSADRVAIVVSTRMLRLETNEGGWFASLYFAGLYDAYNACLYAHRPASFVFTEDATAEVLRGYQAVLLVGQKVDLDPQLDEALQAVRANVYADATCHPKYLTAFHPLGFGFDQVDLQREPAWQGDDTSYYRLRRAFLAQGAAVAGALAAVPPVAECDNPEVLLSERTAGDITYIWAVNNTMPDWEPETAWRVGLLCAQRLPVQARLKVRLPLLHQVVDVLTGAPVALLDGVFTADLRTVPARLYAIVPLLHEPLPTASEDGFGPHVRDIAVAADGRTAALNTFDWDHNLYGLDLATGRTRWRQRVGHHFAYAPVARPDGFAVQGFDLGSAEGYHLYQLDPAGRAQRRYALFGLPKKATDWSKSEWGYDYGLSNFAVAPGGSWTASCGDLGLAVWDEEGQQKWTHPWWEQHRRTPLRLLALDDDTLITFADDTVTGLSAADGRTLWTFATTENGSLGGAFGAAAVSGDRRTAVIASEADGGRVLVIRDGTLANTLPTAASEVSLSADGSFLVVTTGNQLRAFDTAGGLLWTYTGDDFLRRPRVSPDSTRIAVGSELGTLSVLGRDGTLLTATDLRALPVPAWLPDGDLLVATWTGTVIRYDADLEERWRTRLVPEETDIRPKLQAPDPVPVVRAEWGNARSEAYPLTPNLLVQTHAYLGMRTVDPDRGMTQDPNEVFGLLTDGSADPPAVPWLNRTLLNGMGATGSDHRFLFTVDTFRYQLELTGVTIAEDPAHPESWLRDVLLQWWDARAGAWRDGPMLLSDQALHSHAIEPPLHSGRFRFVTTGGSTWPAGNLRLGELVLHGRVLGPSHRDVVENNGLAVLFDDRVDDMEDLLPASPYVVDIQEGGAYAGHRCLRVPVALPGAQYPIRHGLFFLDTMHDWNFEITEHPSAPGQYRYLQFAWKALGAGTTGIGLRLGPGGSPEADGDNQYFGVNAGISKWGSPDTLLTQITVPADQFPAGGWRTVRVDLWAASTGRLKKITQLGVRTDGGGALFDQIVLGRTEADLPQRPAQRLA
ncbi:PQQ-binding-like beta-propeller repeat protein [Streptomyces sp. NPDC090493]|uniref:outer membrane protein assembly factor BamB family protein n=1 Tax=Streptomyces sp. NPDC090493 TaxID=3365964 RepID=UPI00382A27F8